jgi:hypothetical protein
MVYNTQDYCFFFFYFSIVRYSTDSPLLPEDPVSETSCFLVSRIPDDGKVKKKQKTSNSNLQFYTVSQQSSVLSIRPAYNTVPWRAYMNLVNKSGFLKGREFSLAAE